MKTTDTILSTNDKGIATTHSDELGSDKVDQCSSDNESQVGTPRRRPVKTPTSSSRRSRRPRSDVRSLGRRTRARSVYTDILLADPGADEARGGAGVEEHKGD